MKKEKIKSINHTNKVWWIRVSPTSRSVKSIHEILKKFDSQGWGLGDGSEDPYFEEKLSFNYKKWKNNYEEFFVDNECGYIFFMEKEIHILLRKETKLFDMLRNEFLKYFEIPESKTNKKK